MKRIHVLLAAILIFAMLAACGGKQAEEVPAVQPEAQVPQNTEPVVQPEPEPPKADIGGTELTYDVTSLDLTSMAFDFDKLMEASANLTAVTEISLGTTELTAEQIAALQEAYPAAAVDYTVALFDQVLPKDTETLDLAAMTADQTDELVDALALLPAVKEINFVSEEGICVYTTETIAELDKVQAAAPDAYLKVCFDLFGQIVTSEDERIEYYLVEVGNEGTETVRAVLPYLKSCTYFLMDGCGVDNEVMAQLREDFPETKIVWRIWLTEPNYNDRTLVRAASVLTDTHRVRTTYVRDNNVHNLYYCNETKYVDVGHVSCLTDVSFLAYMPDLEVCIIAITAITDITPLANHDKLEYLELFTTPLADLTPLATCPNLEHLNISNMPNLKDITPIYGLQNLKRLRMVSNPMLPNSMKEEVEVMLPNCEIMNQGIWPTGWFWRYDENQEMVPRYALLREQMEYEIDFSYGIP